MKKQPIEGTVSAEELTVEYWRGKFPDAFSRFDTLIEVAEELAKLDPQSFGGIPGYKRLENVKRGIAGLLITAKAVRLMEQVRPAEPQKKSLLGRQNLVKR